ncbi:MAG: hypothetical protein ABIJ61_05680, partial [bacterium]
MHKGNYFPIRRTFTPAATRLAQIIEMRVAKQSGFTQKSFLALCGILILLVGSVRAELAGFKAMAPCGFIANQGQWPSQIHFRAETAGATIWLAEDGIYYQFVRLTEASDRLQPLDPKATTPPQAETVLIKASFRGARTNAVISGVDPLASRCNYFLGDDPSRWQRDVPGYREVIYTELYPGIDLRCSSQTGAFKYEFILEPGVDPALIEIVYENVTSFGVAANGELTVGTIWGSVSEKPPYVYQPGGAEIVGAYQPRGDRSFGFALGTYNPDLPLVIDPEVTYSTYLG